MSLQRHEVHRVGFRSLVLKSSNQPLQLKPVCPSQRDHSGGKKGQFSLFLHFKSIATHFSNLSPMPQATQLSHSASWTHLKIYVTLCMPTAHRNALLKGTKTVISLLSHSAVCTVYHKYTYASTLGVSTADGKSNQDSRTTSLRHSARLCQVNVTMNLRCLRARTASFTDLLKLSQYAQPWVLRKV